MNKNEKKLEPLISVIVPVYKTERYIRHCIDSILEQTYKNLEIILVDDGSPDKCGEICDEYQKVDERVKVIHSENNGVGAARNEGLRECNGEFITFVDSDDFLSRNFIEVLYSQIDEEDYISCGFFRSGENGCIQYVLSTEEDRVFNGKDILYGHYTGKNAEIQINSVYVCGKLYRKQLWEGLFFPERLLYEDIYLMPYILLKAKKVKFISYTGYYYRETPNSIMTSTNVVHREKAFKDSFYIWDHHINLYKKHSFFELVNMVECLKIEKIISHSITDTIPKEKEEFVQHVMKESVRNVIKTSIPTQKKIKYILFLMLGRKNYKFLRKIIKC